MDNEPRLQGKQQKKDQQSYIPISEVYLKYLRGRKDHQQRHKIMFRAAPYGKFIEIKGNLWRNNFIE